MSTSTLFSLLKSLTNSTVFFGPQGFDVIQNESELSSAQQGFSIDNNNQPLITTEKANWQDNWLVFARDTELGDPYFVDTNNQTLPVYTAFLTEQGWQTELVAKTLHGFIKCLNLLFSQTEQQTALYIADENCISELAQLHKLQKQLIADSQSKFFWQTFIKGYIDWLNDDNE